MKDFISKNDRLIFIIGTALLVFTMYSFSLNRGWQIFDEKEIFFNESIFPTPSNLKELFEVISTYAFSYHVESQNLTFSNIINIRSNFGGAILNIVAQFLFKKNPMLYHLLGVTIHTVNTIFIWLVFSLLFNMLHTKKRTNYILSSFFCLLWALHPANVESVMVGANWTSLITYGLCFLFLLHCLKKIHTSNYQYTSTQSALITIGFFISISISEYSYSLPFIIFFITTAFLLKNGISIKESLKDSFKISSPYLEGGFYYFLYLAFKHLSSSTEQYSSIQTLNISIERLFGLTPQVFIHFFKVLLFPKALSIFQTNLVYLSNSLTSPYSIVSLLFFIIFLIIPMVFIIVKKNYGFLLVYSFLFSVFPFLHILAPAYCIFADRYCYFPSFMFLFLLGNLLPQLKHKINNKALALIAAIILIAFSARTAYRINDWKNAESIYTSASKHFKNSFYKGITHSILGYYYDSIGNVEKTNTTMQTAIDEINKGINELSSDPNKKVPSYLKEYGLDPNSLIITGVFRIASIRFNLFKEPADKILSFCEPFLKDNLEPLGNSALDLYSKLLLATNQKEKALEVLEYAKSKYPFSPTIIFSLSHQYLNSKDLYKAEKILKEGYFYYPNYIKILPRMVKLAELKNDYKSLAQFQYLIGLRNHSEEAYQKSLQLYLQLNNLTEAKKVVEKLFIIDNRNPVTLLFTSKYLLMGNKRLEAIKNLESAYEEAQNPQRQKQVYPHLTENILLSLISLNLSENNLKEVFKYIQYLEVLPDTLSTTKANISNLKKHLIKK